MELKAPINSNKNWKNQMKSHKLILKQNKYILPAIVVACINVIYFNNYVISLVFVFIEIFILAYYYFKDEITKYLGYYLMFLTLSLEFETFIGFSDFYGFKNFRLFGINLGIIFLIPLVVKIINRPLKFKLLKSDYTNLYKFIKILFILILSAAFFGILNIMINDNSIQNISGFLRLYFGEIYLFGLYPLMLIISFLYILTYERKKIHILSDFLIGIIVGVSFSLIIGFFFNLNGTYGGNVTLLVSSVSSFIPLVIYMFFNDSKSIKSKSITFIFVIFSTILLLRFNSSGKLLIALVFTLILIPLVLVYRKKYLILFIFFISIPIMLILLVQLINLFSLESNLFGYKLYQVRSLLEFWNPNWLSQLPSSPEFRVNEFLNIAHEFLEKPWYMFLGKGYLGSIKDYLNVFEYSLEAFTAEEWFNQTFYYMHFTLNSLFLTNGIFGIFTWLYVLFLTIKKLNKTQWGIVGAYWFLIFYGYSLTISAFGIVALLLSLYQLGEEMKSTMHKQELQLLN